jgi:hypothetical protein
MPTGATWPIGAYRVQVTVTDADGATIERMRAFRLDPDARP